MALLHREGENGEWTCYEASGEYVRRRTCPACGLPIEPGQAVYRGPFSRIGHMGYHPECAAKLDRRNPRS